jgi:hypothetical protein
LELVKISDNRSKTTSPKFGNFFRKKDIGSFSIKSKFTNNHPNAIYKHEADAMADKVTGNESTQQPFFRPVITTIQRKHEEEDKLQRKQSNTEAGATSSTESYLSSLSGGRNLNENERTFFEPRMGSDFSDIRLHTDNAANQSAKEINALAYTSGNNIVFGSGQYQPGTAAGRQLLAHELTHTIQQKAVAAAKIQRSTAGTVSFDPPKVIRKNPLAKINSGETPGKTKLTINGNEVDDSSFANQLTDIKQKITPTAIVQQPNAGGTKGCSFDSSFNLKTSAKIFVITPPGAKGWSGRIDMTKINPAPPTPCAGKGLVPATMTAKPTDQSYATLVEDSEMEHVKELETLHNRHFEPYYHFIKRLNASGADEQDCSKNLTDKIDKRDDQAALGFGLADVAETRKFDAPGSTHHGTTLITKIGAGCSSAELEATQDNPQVVGNQPGNVPISASVQTVIDNTKLKVSGNDLTDTAGFTKTFSSAANAIMAMRILRAYRITSINTIGKFQFILNGVSPPAGKGPASNEVAIDPSLYQVTISHPNPDEWMISQVNQDRVLPIIKFGAARDDAYSAIEQMRKYNFVSFGFVGSDPDNPEFLYFKT